MPLPRRSPPPITPGSAPRYMIWLEQPYSRLFSLGGSWAGGWVSLFARSGQSERCGQSPNDGISSWRPLSARVTPTQSFITQRRFQRVSSFRWPRKAKLISLPPLPITLALACRPLPTMPSSFPASQEHLCSGEVSCLTASQPSLMQTAVCFPSPSLHVGCFPAGDPSFPVKIV